MRAAIRVSFAVRDTDELLPEIIAFSFDRLESVLYLYLL